MAMGMRSSVFWVTTSLKISRRFGGICRFQQASQARNHHEAGRRHDSAPLTSNGLHGFVSQKIELLKLYLKMKIII
jgi:hypothetical protein